MSLAGGMYTLGTAGHVDHGKSTLIHALTGMNPDRLQEEIERQMTIDLGFAWFTLDDGQEIGIVDVPGHRDFIDNMLAGIGAIDGVLCVIAADEGIMPQTREHLAILDLLQIPRGIVVITKTDLVEEEWLSLVVEDVEGLISTTSIADAPIIPVSAIKGHGLDALRDQIKLLIQEAERKVDHGKPRLSIDRVFTLTGFGTVVTGTLVGGSFTEGQEVEIRPGGLKARIRNLQSHKTARDRVEPGGRVAINLSGLRKSQLQRGDCVVLPGQWHETTLIDARFNLLPTVKEGLRHNQEVKLYLGAAQRIVRVRLIGQPEILPGESGWVQLILQDGVIVERGDRFILRRPSPGATLGGGRVADPHPEGRYRLKDREPMERLEKLLEGDPDDMMLEHVRLNEPIMMVDIKHAGDPDIAMATIEKLRASGELVLLGSGEVNQESYIVTAGFWEKTRSFCAQILSTYHQQNPLRTGMPIQEFRTRMKLDSKWASHYMEKAEDEGWIDIDQTFVRDPGFKPSLTQQQQKAAKLLLNRFESNPYNTPSRREILELIDEELLQYLVSNGDLISLSSEVFFSSETYGDAIDKVKEVLGTKGTLTVAEVRDFFQTTRKYALALMEHLDEVGITIREGDVRRLRP